MNNKKCKDCEKCIIWQGRARCGLARAGYIFIDINDPACEHFDDFNEESET